MDYFRKLADLFFKIEVRDNNAKAISLSEGILKVAKLILALGKRKNKIILIGNGGSASIAGHIAIDFLKNAKIPAIVFNDVSLLTCISNDLGYEYVFQKPIELLAKKGDMLFAISSSGSSKNILNAAKEAKKRGCFLITLSGFSKGNPLRKLGHLNFYLPAASYGYVEITHLVICHCIIDTLIENRKLNGQI
jgi:D-sedoheptulose 7-phosphate isomerase